MMMQARKWQSMFESRLLRPKLSLMLSLTAACLLFAVGAANAADDDDSSVAWKIDSDVAGRFVAISKSGSSFQQDHKMRTGGEIRFEGGFEWDDHRTLEIRGLGQSGEAQGFFVSEYDKLGHYGLTVDFSSWREYYNSRSGRLPQTSNGLPLAGNTFPGTNDYREVFGGSSPSTDWLTGGVTFDYQPSNVISNVYVDIRGRHVDGDQTLLKTGAVYTDVKRGLSSNLSGLVDFAFPARKDVDYLSYMGSTGADSNLGNANWQFDLSYGSHTLKSETREVNFFTKADGMTIQDAFDQEIPRETEIYKEDTKLHVGKLDAAVARHLAPGVYVYGAGTFTYERSDPEPGTDVVRPGLVTPTRTTERSKVSRYSPGINLGVVLQPMSSLVIRGGSSFRYTRQAGRLTEIRDEGEDLVTPSEVGSARSVVDRNGYVGRANVSLDAKLPNRMTLTFDTRYRYRREEVESRRLLNIAGRLPESEKFSSERHRVELGPTMKWRLRRGRSVEMGYRFLHEDFNVEIDRVAQQFVLNDFDRERHKLYLKARGRIARSVRGEARFEYMIERRDMQGPEVDTLTFAADAPGKIDTESAALVTSIYWQASKEWNLNGGFTVRQLKIDLVGDFVQPFNKSQLTDFKYNAVTETLTMGASYRPSDKWSASFSYSLYASDESVDNLGQTVRLAGDLRLTDTWRAYGNYGFYSYRRSGTGVDNYDAQVIGIGVNAQF